MYIKDYKVHQVPKGSKGSKGYRESKESKGCRGYKGCEPDGSPIQPVLFVLASAATRIMELSEATTSSDETWQMFLFYGLKPIAYDLESAFETLQSYSLIQWKPDQKSYAMHKLVHAWGQDRLETDGQRQLSSLALKLITDATAEDQIDPTHQLRLVPHVMASFGMFSSLCESLDELAMDRLAMVDRMEGFLLRIGRWSKAYKVRVFHFRKTEKMLGNEHPSTLTSMNNLAEVLSS